jgi:hypothetical protein
MTIDPVRLRVRIGLDPADTTQDDQLAQCLADATAMVEVYLDRQLIAADVVEQFEPGDKVLILRAWPVTAITSIVTAIDAMTVDPTTYYANLPAGRIYARSTAGFYARRGECWPHAALVVSYNGGFVALPSPLEWALLQLFDLMWALDPSYGGTAGASSVGATIQKVSVIGVGSLDYGWTESRTARDQQASPWGMLPTEVMDVLNRYANNAVMGVG